ncbi:Alpha/beta hydrolase [Sulfidibacter corallicola]|uniref:Alpha/beta hydrolase n=1 Tax=Sulfidibacter corallicola TaxID=2818388 RepID=A0A8A4TPN2_SULCO|nr:alpha/beta hydrolase-fold protein [Sulfidibacter corallicola]QTD51503.1 alpha/beta hydrolase [Sulfidibacter corallicola]
MSEEHTCTLRIHYDTGWDHRITIRGDRFPFSWDKGVDAEWTEGNCWVYRWTCQHPEGIKFKVLIDDVTWAIGTDGTIFPGQAMDIYPFFHRNPGRLELVHHFNMPIHIYLPPGYDENPTKRFPVLYIHDGQNLYDPIHSFKGEVWNVDQAIENLVLEESMDPVIAVGIFNRGAGRLYDYTPSYDPHFQGIGAGGGANQYADLIINEIKPYVDLNFRTLADGAHTGLMGASLGGLVSLYMARRWPGVFSRVASLSSSFWWNNRNLLSQITRTREFVPLRIYLDAGTHNDGLPETRAMYEALIQSGYQPGRNLFYYVAPWHAHSEVFWGARVHLPLRFLFPPWSTDPVGTDPVEVV